MNGDLPAAAAGDLDGNISRLAAELRRLRFPAAFNAAAARDGSPSALLPVLHYMLLGFSRHVAQWLVEAGYELHSKSDARFVNCVWRLCRAEFAFRPALTEAQFMHDGAFAEARVLFAFLLTQHCKRMHNKLLREHRQANVPAVRSASQDRLSTARRARSASSELSADAPISGRVRTPMRVEVVPGSAVYSRVERAQPAPNPEPLPVPQTALLDAASRESDGLPPSAAAELERRLRVAEAALTSQAATIARLETRIRALEAERPAAASAFAAVSPPPAPAMSSEQELEAFMLEVQQHFTQTQALLANVR